MSDLTNIKIGEQILQKIANDGYGVAEIPSRGCRALLEELASLRSRLATVVAERDESELKLKVADHALRSCLALATRNKDANDWAHVVTFCGRAGVKRSILRGEKG